MSGSQRRGMIGVALLLVVALAVGAYQFAGGGGGGGEELVVVRGTIGSEKVGFLDNPEIRKILADRYGLQVDFASAGSLQMMDHEPGDQDFLWPGSQIAEEIFAERYGTALTTEAIFNSPIVLYSWAPVADALIAAGLVEENEGTLYVTDFPRLIQLIDSGTQWSEIGMPQLFGRVSIVTTDPTTSNSGNSFSGLLASTLNGGQVVDESTIDGVLPQVKAFYARLGLLEQSSGDLFDQYVKQGMGAYPIIAGYESSLIEFSLANRDAIDRIKSEIRLLYPRPTVWSSHPMIALTANGQKLIQALKDEEIQRIAWESHGFRSGLLGVQNDPEVLEVAGVPATVTSVMPLPRAAVMERIIQELRPANPNPTFSADGPGSTAGRGSGQARVPLRVAAQEAPEDVSLGLPS